MFFNTRFLKLAKQPLVGQSVYLKMAEKQHFIEFQKLRFDNQEFLTPFEPKWRADALSKRAFYARVRNDRFLASNDDKYAYLIFKKSDDCLIGGINMNNINRGVFQACSLGYWLAKNENSKGLMSDAVRTLTKAAFENWKFNRIQAATLVGNLASIRVLEKNGFEQEGLAKRYLKINGRWQDHLLFAKVAPI